MYIKDRWAKKILDHIVIRMMGFTVKINIRLSLAAIWLTALHKIIKLAFLIKDHYVQVQNKSITASLVIHQTIVLHLMELLAATWIGLREELEVLYVTLLTAKIAKKLLVEFIVRATLTICAHI